MKPQDFENRVIDFAEGVIGIVDSLPNTKAGNYIPRQLGWSGMAPAPTDGEARSPARTLSAMKIALEELRETMIWQTTNFEHSSLENAAPEDER